jgi:uncharacterized membrane protein YdbT with pleckstrin-like domain
MPQTKISKYIPGEEVIFILRPSYFILLSQILPIFVVMAALFFIFYSSGLSYWWVYVAALVAGGFIVAVVFLHWYSTIFELTNKRVKNRVGIFGSREEEISLDDIQAVDVDQTFWGLVFNFGNVLIKSSGASREVDFTNITSPKKIANRVSDLSIPQ